MGNGVRMEEALRRDGISLSIAHARRLAKAAPIATIGKTGKARRVIPTALQHLRCVDCRRKVRFCPDHLKHAGRTEIHAYFGLTRNSRHADACRYTVAEAITRIVATSREATGDELIVPDNGRFRFRLHVLTEALDDVATVNARAESSSHVALRRTEYERGARRLEPYLRTATAIAKLYQRISDPTDLGQLRDTITIRHEDDDVPWDDFCYDESRWPALLARLRSCERLPHPVALVGTFGNISMTRSSTGAPTHRRSTLLLRHGDENLCVQIYGRDGRALKRARANTRVVVVGRPWGGRFNDGGHGKAIRMRIESPSQIAAVL